MAKLELTLYREGGFSHTVKEDYISGQKFIDYLNFLNDIDKNATEWGYIEVFVKKVEFLASLFTTEKVTSEDIIQGVRSWELVDTVDQLLATAMGVKDEDPKLDDSVLQKLESVT